jgi:hypothetical protein
MFQGSNSSMRLIGCWAIFAKAAATLSRRAARLPLPAKPRLDINPTQSAERASGPRRTEETTRKQQSFQS